MAMLVYQRVYVYTYIYIYTYQYSLPTCYRSSINVVRQNMHGCIAAAQYTRNRAKNKTSYFCRINKHQLWGHYVGLFFGFWLSNIWRYHEIWCLIVKKPYIKDIDIMRYHEINDDWQTYWLQCHPHSATTDVHCGKVLAMHQALEQEEHRWNLMATS